MDSIKRWARTFVPLVLIPISLVVGIFTSVSTQAAFATTLTCTNIASATTGPIGCGGAQSALTTHGSLDMAVLGTGNASGNYYNSPVGVRLDSQSNVREDFTVFALNGDTTGGPGNLGRYVAMYTPNGKVQQFTGTVGSVFGTYTNAVPDSNTTFTAGANAFCVSVTQIANGPHGALRWNAVLRNCNTNGTFTKGNNSTVENSVTFGHANRWQLWAPAIGSHGLELINTSLRNTFNVDYVLDIKGSGGDGSRLLAFPGHDALNEEWSIIGCTHPADELNVGSYQFCP
jgi:hypothetical protein